MPRKKHSLHVPNRQLRCNKKQLFASMDVGGHMNKPKFLVRYTALVNRAAAVAKHEGGIWIERRDSVHLRQS